MFNEARLAMNFTAAWLFDFLLSASHYEESQNSRSSLALNSRIFVAFLISTFNNIRELRKSWTILENFISSSASITMYQVCGFPHSFLEAP